MAVQQALKNANVDLVRDIDGIAFTRGPGTLMLGLFNQADEVGIGGCLSVGSNAAKSLAAALNKPLVGVHHMVSITMLNSDVISLSLVSKAMH